MAISKKKRLVLPELDLIWACASGSSFAVAAAVISSSVVTWPIGKKATALNPIGLLAKDGIICAQLLGPKGVCPIRHLSPTGDGRSDTPILEMAVIGMCVQSYVWMCVGRVCAVRWMHVCG